MAKQPGEIQVQRVTPGVVLTRMRGHATLEHFAPIKSAVDAELEGGGRPAVFHDWEAMTGYDSAVRVAMADWYRGVEDRVAEVHVLASNRMVAMGVAVVALAVGARIQSHASRASFERALADAMRRA